MKLPIPKLKQPQELHPIWHVPVILCQEYQTLWCFWCDRCQRWHSHSSKEGLRVAHCNTIEPFRYYLQLASEEEIQQHTEVKP